MSTIGVWALSATLLVGVAEVARRWRGRARARPQPAAPSASPARAVRQPKIIEARRDPSTGVYTVDGSAAGGR